MKAILAGLGNFGSEWYRVLQEHYPHIGIAVVEQDEGRRSLLRGDVPAYRSLPEAIARERPDFLLNATPPAAHAPLNHIAFDYGLPVLCEKPMADSFEAAIAMTERASREGIPFMIAENYRWFSIVRQARSVIAGGEIGPVASARVDFYRNHRTAQPYFQAMTNPLLEDIAIHHFDMMRCLFDCDADRIVARSFNPPGSGFANNVGLHAMVEMGNGAVVSYAGSFVTCGEETPWHGMWRIEGALGTLMLEADRLRIINADGNRSLSTRGMAEKLCLDEFLDALQEGRMPEASGSDYIRTQALAHAAQISHATGRWAAVVPIGEIAR